MASQVLDSYLVSLGWQNDTSSYQKFKRVLADADALVDRHTGGIAKTLLKVGTSLVGTYTAISAAVVGLADKVALQDQSWRLMGLRMLMTTESARKLDLVTKALGADLASITWDPELHQRAVLMSQDIDKMAAGLGTDFEPKMKRLRDIRYEFSRLEVVTKFLGMGLVSSLFDKLPIDKIQSKVTGWVNWLEDHIPELSEKFSTLLVPILKDTWQLFLDIGHMGRELANVFTNLIGSISGDKSIQSVQGTNASFDQMATAIGHVVKETDHLINKFTELLSFIDKHPILASVVAHAAAGAVVGSVVPGVGTAAGAAVGAAYGLGTGLAESHYEAQDEKRRSIHDRLVASGAMPVDQDQKESVRRRLFGAGVTEDEKPGTQSVQDSIRQAARRYNVPEALVLGVARKESGFDQGVTSPKGAIGVMQLMPGTAKDLNVDPMDQEENIKGGVKYLAYLLKRYSGNEEAALGAYNWGQGNMDKFLAGQGELPKETRDYIPRVQAFERQYAGQTTITVGDIHIMQPNATPDQIQKVVAAAVQEHADNQIQADLAQLSQN